MIILDKTTDITDYVGYDKASAWQAIFDWFLQRGNVSTYFNIGGNVYRLRKDERGFYNFEQQAGEYWGGNLFNRTKKGLVEEMRKHSKFLQINR